MRRGTSFRSERSNLWIILGWGFLIVVGVGLAWYGFTWNGSGPKQVAVQPSATATASLLPSVTPLPALPPTATPAPTFTPLPTLVPPTQIPAVPSIVTGADGANVRTGPGTNFSRVGYLDPGAEARVTGRYNDWWQIEYEGGMAWVFGGIVTASNADGVVQVQPPPSPTPPPPTSTPLPTATPVPAEPTSLPGPPAEFRGLDPISYSVEDAPGPFDAGSQIWFNMEIKNTNNYRVYYESLGTWVQETGKFQESWTKQKFSPDQYFTWRDHIKIKSSGTYHLWMRICFEAGACVNLKGPVTVKVE